MDSYVVIGNPIAHSQSPEIHTQFAMQTGQSMHYDRLLSPLTEFAATLHAFHQRGGRGANVTVPFKLEAYELATRLSDRARVAGAVNTLSLDGNDIIGDNTDGIGLVNDIVHNAGVALRDRKVLLLGAGGAARGVMFPLLEQQPQQVVLCNRTLAKAQELMQQFVIYGNVSVAENADSTVLATPFDIVINATSASLMADIPSVPATVFTEGTLAYDMMYAKQDTAFMQFARQHGAIVRDGLGMLVEQAAEAFFLWRGVRPDTAPVFNTLYERLGRA